MTLSPTTSRGATAIVRSATVTLTNAQVKTLRSATVEVIPAPAATQVLILLGGLMTFDCAAGAYSNITTPGNLNTSSVSLVYGDDDAQASGFLSSANLLGAAALAYAPVVSVHSLVGTQGTDESLYTLSTTCLGANVRLVAYNADGNYTGGNVANTLKVTTFYAVADA